MIPPYPRPPAILPRGKRRSIACLWKKLSHSSKSQVHPVVYSSIRSNSSCLSYDTPFVAHTTARLTYPFSLPPCQYSYLSVDTNPFLLPNIYPHDMNNAISLSRKLDTIFDVDTTMSISDASIVFHTIILKPILVCTSDEVVLNHFSVFCAEFLKDLYHPSTQSIEHVLT